MFPHSRWQQQNIPTFIRCETSCYKSRQGTTCQWIAGIRTRALSQSIFFVDKKNRDKRLINDVQLLNGVTIKDSDMPSSVDEFYEDFSSYLITSAVDYYSGYN